MRKKSLNQALSAPLRKGDLVDIIAPGSRCSDQDLENGVRRLESWGLKVRVSPELFGDDVICANSDKKRFEHLKRALFAKDSRGIWCARGGYGAIRFSQELRKLKRPARSKLLVGYSDVTTIHHFLNQFWKWPTLHAPLLDRIGREATPQAELSELSEVLFGERAEVVFSGLQPMNDAAKKNKKIKAAVSGGNLMVLNSTLGGPIAKPPQGLLFLEETGERGYRVDRLLIQMQLAGYFKKVSAIVLGDFLGGREVDGKDMVTPVLERFARETKVPVLRGLEAGHGDLQRPVFFGAPAILETGASCALRIPTPKFK